MKQLFMGFCWPTAGYLKNNPSKWTPWLRSHDIEHDGDADFTSEDKFELYVWVNNGGTFTKQ